MNRLSLLVLIVVLSACATPYQKTGLTGGFSETQLVPNIFRVDFKGNAYTSYDRAADFTLLRSAELALQNGFRYFVIVDSQAWEKRGVITTPTTTQTTMNANTLGTLNTTGNYGTYQGTTYGTATTRTYGGQSFLISKPRISNTIVCFTE